MDYMYMDILNLHHLAIDLSSDLQLKTNQVLTKDILCIQALPAQARAADLALIARGI